MGTIKVDRRELNFLEKLYWPEVLKGVGTTTRHLIRNMFGHKEMAGKEMQTLYYPEIKREYPERFRGRHRLMRRDDGQVRCVACMLCATACPANCIHIVAGEHDDGSIEKYPISFEIDLLVCVFCGMCEEACPCDAIRLDSGVHPMPSYSRDKQRIRKAQLLSQGSLSISQQGGENA